MSDLINSTDWSVLPIDIDDYDDIITYETNSHYVDEDDDCY